VVTAVAQTYTEDGQELPERVSLQYYTLGLEETTAPVIGSVTSSFGFRDHPVSGEYTFHTAVDLGVSTGTDVLSFADGTVEYIGENSIYGLYVKVDHDNGVATFYAHCSKLLVSKGDTVSCGQVIAKSGQTGNATGPHLHFSIEKDGVRLDPTYYLELS
jgi:murein DD-endopeptidase MepM/ murein hydrolase activator NlpD